MKILSKEFNVSLNILLGAPRKLICQCCGMPLEDEKIISHDSDDTLNVFKIEVVEEEEP